MTKAQLEEIVAHFLEAAPAIIVAARSQTFDRSCAICKAAQGEQHHETCALWGLVAGRIDYHRLSDSRAGMNGAEPATYIETMAVMEQGGNFASTAPELDFAPSASADTERWPA